MRFNTLQRVVGLLMLLISVVSCQSFYGTFKVDDNAFAAQTGPILLSPTKGLFTTEWGGKATFTIVCDHQPTAPVIVALSSNNTSEGTVTPTSVTFTSVDWKAPQVITVTGVEDTVPDPNHGYKIITDPAVSSDQTFNRKDPIDIDLVNVDNETAGVTVVPRSGLVTTEAGGQDIFSVVLNSKPEKDVIITVVSDDPAEGTVSPDRLVFTITNWMAPQLVTVTGQDDHFKDPAHAYKINLTTTSDDQNYAHVAALSVDVVNQDNESAGVTVALLSGVDPIDPTKLRTSENGDSATFSVVLNAPPSAAVVIPLASDTPGEGTISTESLTFTPENWSAPQVVTVTGIEDDETADGDQPYLIVLGVPTGDDHDYTALSETDVPVVNTDNDKPGFTLMLLSGIDPQNPGKLLTSESGASATFSLALNSRPMSPVFFQLRSGIDTEAKVTPESLTFTPDNWKAPQIVTVKGLEDDGVQDGSPLFYVKTDVATSDDPRYVLDPPDVQVTNQDNDTADVSVVLKNGYDPATNRLITEEWGTTATFTVALTSKPAGDVTIKLNNSNPLEGSLWRDSLVFTPDNYAAPQTVTVAGVNDAIADGNQPYTITIGPASSPDDPNYDGKFMRQVQLSNRDDDSVGVIVSPTSGLITSEGGKTDSFTIRLQSQPTADVTILVMSSNQAEGKPSVGSVTFTPANWNSNQIVTVTGQEDDVVQDGNQSYKIVLSASGTSKDAGYKNYDPADVTVTNNDNDTAGFFVTPISGLVTTEGGGKATFTVMLTSKPVNTATPGGAVMVKINLSSSKPTEGSVSPASLTFNDVNWGSPQTVTVTGAQDDGTADGDQPYTINLDLAVSADGNYNNHKPNDVSVSNKDDDSPNLVITPLPSQTPAITTEKGGKSTFTVALSSRPTDNVSFSVSIVGPSEGKVSPTTLTFTTANWKTAQTVTVTGLDDDLADGDQQYTVRLGNGMSADPNYKGKFGTDLPFINIDDDVPGLDIVAPPVLQTTEYKNGTAKFTVALKSQPTDSVSIGVSSNRTAEGDVSPSTLVFTTSNWQTPQTVTVTGAQDDVADGPQTYRVKLDNAMSADLNYNGKFSTSLDAQNADDDQAGYAVSDPDSTQTTESGSPVMFSVVLTSKPVDSTTVSLGVGSSNTKEGTVSPSVLQFTTADWNQLHWVTVTGVDDKRDDGDVAYQINFVADADYKALAPPSIVLTNVDDDTLGVLVTPTMCSTTPGTTASFTIRLNSQPSAAVTIPLKSDTPTVGTVSPDSVTFTPSGTGNWETPQTVTVTGLNDGSVGMMTPYTIITDPASAPGETTGYNGYTMISDVSCTTR